MLRKIIDRRLLAVVLFLITVIPLYFLILWNKQLRQQKFEMAETDKLKKPIDSHDTPKSAEKENDIRKPDYKNMAVHDVNTIETKDTTLVSDSAAVEMIVPNIQVAEHKQDSTENADSITPQLTFPDYELAMVDKKKKTNKWQMLAAGSVGPALAQNIYRLIATGRPDTDSEAPAFPENVNTWEDYSRYLHMMAHENMPKDSLALVEIANHNQGDIVEREQHDRPITFGISLNKPLSEKWSIETGLQYSILKSRSRIGDGDYYIGKEQKIHYLGIPLRLSYRIADYKNLSAYGSAGLSLNIPVYGRVNSTHVVANVSMDSISRSVTITPPAQWSTNFSIGLQYRVKPKLTL